MSRVLADAELDHHAPNGHVNAETVATASPGC